MQNEINSLLSLTSKTLDNPKCKTKEILEQILRCEYLLGYINKAEQVNHISKAQKMHFEIQTLSLIATLEKLLKKTFVPIKNATKNTIISKHHEI